MNYKVPWLDGHINEPPSFGMRTPFKSLGWDPPKKYKFFEWLLGTFPEVRGSQPPKNYQNTIVFIHWLKSTTVLHCFVCRETPGNPHVVSTGSPTTFTTIQSDPLPTPHDADARLPPSLGGVTDSPRSPSLSKLWEQMIVLEMTRIP